MNGKAKGSSFERVVCKKLSLWVSHGLHSDLYWRSSLSGGRATVIRARGEENRQGGDICSVAPEGHVLTDWLFMECKHVKNVNLETFILSGKGPIGKWWKQACKQAAEHKREPVLIVKGNFMPIIVVTLPGSKFNPKPVARLATCDIGLLDRILKDKFVPPNQRSFVRLR